MENQVKTFVTGQIGARAKGVGGQLLTTAGNLRTIADQLRADPLTAGAADLAMAGVSRLEGVGQYLSQRDLESMIHDAEAFSRARPWTVAIGGLVVGLSASRVIKAAAARRAIYGADSIELDDDLSSDDSKLITPTTPGRYGTTTGHNSLGGALATG